MQDKDLSNPKDLIGVAKLDMTTLPQVGLLLTAQAAMDGEAKYSAHNWLQYKVSARIYLAAIKRHIALWEAGEELAPDSLAHHLAHVASSCMILMDAQANGTLKDDRVRNPAVIKTLKALNEQIQLDYDAKKAAKELEARRAEKPHGEAKPALSPKALNLLDSHLGPVRARINEERDRNPSPLPAPLADVHTDDENWDWMDV